MIKTELMRATRQDDAELVSESLNGNQDAFRNIVERYQTLICSLAYCATGSVTQSEDLAQETFVAAWKELAELREPSKLRSWLCAILRFRISKQYRRQTREPIHAAESIEAAEQRVAPEAPPSDQAISNEEQAILWCALERIPAMYREPLVLFYREHQSVEAVAQTLELSEDAVKQRLFRGRKMLQNEVLDFITGALERTNPGQAFTLAVLAAVPAMTLSAKAAIITTAAKGGAAAAKATTLGSVLGVLSGPALGVFCGYLGWRTNLKSAKTLAERAFVKRYMIMITVGIVIFTATLLSLNFLMGSHWRPNTGLPIGLGLIFTFAFGLFAFVSAWRFNREFAALRQEERRLHPELFADEKVGPMTGTLSLGPICPVPWEYRSRATLLGLPLVHARGGRLPGEKFKPAMGWIAFGEVAYGLIANGAVAVGGITIGGASFGIISFGGFAFGLLSLGGLSVGAIAMGGAAIGLVASGGIALAWHAALGGLVAARELALGGAAMAHHVNDDIAREFFARYRWLNFMLPGPRNLFWALSFGPVLLQMLVWRWWRRKLVKRRNTKPIRANANSSAPKTQLILLLAALHFVANADLISNRITVTVRGSGPDVVLMPGLASSSAVWDATATRFETNYRLHLVQVDGFAGSPARANTEGAIIQPTVDAINAYIKTNHLKAPRMIGHSLGGLMALMLAVQHSEDVSKLMIVDSLPFFSVVRGVNDAATAAPQAAAMRDMILNETQGAYAQGEKDFLRFLVKSQVARKAAIDWAIASDKSVVARAMYEEMTTDLRPKLREIGIPITVLYPWDASSGFAQSTTDKLYRESFASLPDKALVRIDGSYHFIMLDEPGQFAAQVDLFLK